MAEVDVECPKCSARCRQCPVCDDKTRCKACRICWSCIQLGNPQPAPGMDWAVKQAKELARAGFSTTQELDIASALRQAYLRGEREREAAWAKGHAAATDQHRTQLATIRDRLDAAIAMLDRVIRQLGLDNSKAARILGMEESSVRAWRDMDQPKKAPPDWVFDALGADALIEETRINLERIDELKSTGTGG